MAIGSISNGSPLFIVIVEKKMRTRNCFKCLEMVLVMQGKKRFFWVEVIREMEF